VRLARGDHDGKGTDVPDITAALSGLIALHGMPETKAALVARVGKGLEGSSRLTRGEPQDEVAAFRKLIGMLKEGGGELMGGAAIKEAVSRRSGRWLAPETIDKLVAPPRQPKERYEQLLTLERIIFGDRNKEILAGYLNEIIDNPHTRDILFGRSGTVLDKMRILAKLQAKVLESELGEMLRAGGRQSGWRGVGADARSPRARQGRAGRQLRAPGAEAAAILPLRCVDQGQDAEGRARAGAELSHAAALPGALHRRRQVGHRSREAAARLAVADGGRRPALTPRFA
jgi:hypothetical protein